MSAAKQLFPFAGLEGIQIDFAVRFIPTEVQDFTAVPQVKTESSIHCFGRGVGFAIKLIPVADTDAVEACYLYIYRPEPSRLTMGFDNAQSGFTCGQSASHSRVGF